VTLFPFFRTGNSKAPLFLSQALARHAGSGFVLRSMISVFNNLQRADSGRAGMIHYASD